MQRIAAKLRRDSDTTATPVVRIARLPSDLGTTTSDPVSDADAIVKILGEGIRLEVAIPKTPIESRRYADEVIATTIGVEIAIVIEIAIAIEITIDVGIAIVIEIEIGIAIVIEITIVIEVAIAIKITIAIARKTAIAIVTETGTEIHEIAGVLRTTEIPRLPAGTGGPVQRREEDRQYVETPRATGDQLT